VETELLSIHEGNFARYQITPSEFEAWQAVWRQPPRTGTKTGKPRGIERDVSLSNKREIPGRIYKYRSFSNLTLEALIGDKHFFADPSCFNDPLDTKPVLATDLDAMALAEILRRLVEERVHAEMTAAAETIKSRGPKTINHIEDLSRRRAEQMIAEVRYNATNPDYEIEDPEQLLLRQYIEKELLRRYD
jgi:hypothetical protein